MRLLYITINDGSEPRIVKECRTLSTRYVVDYVGIGLSTEGSYAAAFCKRFMLTRGHHRQPAALAKYWLRTAWRLLTTRYARVHVVNENLVLLFWPLLLLQRNVWLDVFDSMFLRQGSAEGAPQGGLLQWLAYRLPRKIVVTDARRLALVPAFARHKAVVVENYPVAQPMPAPKPHRGDGDLTIFYSGAMTATRGTAFLLGMLEHVPGLRITMAGWLRDDASRALASHPRATFHGTVPQAEAIRLAAEADYILCLYAPIHANNINASPNKVYDAIQAATPLIINAEALISAFVQELGIGYILHSFAGYDASAVAHALLSRKGSYRFEEGLRARYTWESQQANLLG